MSLSAEQAQTSLLDRIGTGRTLDAYVVGVAFLEGGLLAAALGDGRVAFIKSESASPRPSFRCMTGLVFRWPSTWGSSAF